MQAYDADVERMVHETARQCLVAACRHSGWRCTNATEIADLAFRVHAEVLRRMWELPPLVEENAP